MRTPWRLYLTVISILIGLTTIAAGLVINDSFKRVSRASETLQYLEVIQGESLRSIAILQGQVALAREDLRLVRRNLSPFLGISKKLGWIPVLGGRFEAAPELLSLGEEALEAAEFLLNAADILALRGQSGPTSLFQGNQFSPAILNALTETQPLFLSALASLDEVKSQLDQLEMMALPEEWSELVKTARQAHNGLTTLAQTGLIVSQSGSRILGSDEPQTYLIVAQNSDELRATGGFIPGAWLLVLDHGEITTLEFWDTVAIDDLDVSPLPPIGIIESLVGGVWLFRDAGWYPDYPTSARAMERLFELGVRISVDGVISLNQWSVKDIVDVLGPIVLSDGQTVDGSNYLRVLELGTDIHGRGFVDTVFQALLEKLRTANTQDFLMALMISSTRSLNQKDILFYYHDPDLQELARTHNWDGAVDTSPGDYLMIIDSNVGFSKVNRNVSRRIRYQVDLSLSGESQAFLDILYTNRSIKLTPDPCRVQAVGESLTSYEEQKNACYWNYLRIYTPYASTLISSSPLPMPQGALYRRIGYDDIEDTLRVYVESGKSVFAGFFTVAPQNSQRVAFAYALPPEVLRGESDGTLIYSLTVQKQPGTTEDIVDIIIRIPAGYHLWDAEPTPDSSIGQEVRFSVSLDVDKKFTLKLQR